MNLIGHLFRIANENLIVDDKPALDSHADFWDQIDPFGWLGVRRTNLDDSAVRSTFICQDENSVAQKMESKRVVDLFKDQFRRAFWIEMPHVDVGKSLVLKTAYKKHQSR